MRSTARSRCRLPRRPLAYLADIVEACDTIDLPPHGLDPAGYRRDPIIRAAVECPFTTIGDEIVWGSADHGVPARRAECEGLLIEGEALDAEAVHLAVGAHVRHHEAAYDALLASAVERREARERVAAGGRRRPAAMPGGVGGAGGGRPPLTNAIGPNSV